MSDPIDPNTEADANEADAEVLPSPLGPPKPSFKQFSRDGEALLRFALYGDKSMFMLGDSPTTDATWCVSKRPQSKKGNEQFESREFADLLAKKDWKIVGDEIKDFSDAVALIAA